MASSRTEARLEKAARETSAHLTPEEEARRVREKTARLRALRLAKEAADQEAGVPSASAEKRVNKKAAKKPKKNTTALSAWLSDQKSQGRST